MQGNEIQAPAFLRKRGITTVSDNVPAGHRVNPPAGLLFTLFREELMNSSLVKRHETAAAHGNESTG